MAPSRSDTRGRGGETVAYAAESVSAVRRARLLSDVASDAPSAGSCAQRLILEDFPSTALSRALSPNGRAHWATRRKARELVEHVVGHAIFDQRLTDELLGGQVRITYRWVFPDRRRRDLDNHSTGVVKAVQDAFVRLGLIDADDTSCVVGISTEIAVERHRRALEITLEPSPSLSDGGEGVM